MAFGLGVLKLPPTAFWGMTLKELAAVCGGLTRAAGAPIGRRDLDALLSAYPDATHDGVKT
jgi:uncharacterized phage protein (TIGR02216 family)